MCIDNIIVFVLKKKILKCMLPNEEMGPANLRIEFWELRILFVAIYFSQLHTSHNISVPGLHFFLNSK